MIPFLLVAVACFQPEVVDAEATFERVIVHDITSVPVPAHMPTELQVSGDKLVVVDGYKGSLVELGDAEPKRFTPAALGHPTRIAAHDGGWWMVDPGDHDREGALLRTDYDGTIEAAVPIIEFDPISIVEHAGALVVGTRDRGLVWLDTTTGAVVRDVTKDVDDQVIGAITDVVEFGDGLLVVDTGQARVHILDAEGTPVDTFGSWGLSAGRLHRPRSVTPVDGGGFLVADMGLAVVQLYAADGAFLGVVSSEDDPLDVSNPVAVRRVGVGSYAVLDAGKLGEESAKVVKFTLSAAEVVARTEAPRPRHLRVALGDAPEGGDTVEGALGGHCHACHDGFLNDGRAVWDTTRHHHPLDIPEGFEIPEELPTFEGKMGCPTCHSPHAESGAVFLRMPFDDGTLCHACHGENPHEKAVQKMPTPGGAHPTGGELLGDEAVSARDCGACHAPHAAGDEPLLRDETDGQVCMACHAEKADEKRNHALGRFVGKDVPVERRGARLVHARDGGLGCRTCHDLVGGTGKALIARPNDGGPLCLACHSERNAVADGLHATIGRSGLACLGCHDPHDRSIDNKLLIGANGSCQRCHADQARTIGHPRNDEATCLSCHDPHAATVREDAPCVSCHEDQRPAHAGLQKCESCHPPHGVAASRPPAEGNRSAGACLSCHGDGGTAVQIEHWRHPQLVFAPDGSRWTPLSGLTLFGRDGNPVAEGQMGELACGSCHVAHGEKLTRRDEGWKAACSSCHGDDTLLFYRYFHRPERRGAR